MSRTSLLKNHLESTFSRVLTLALLVGVPACGDDASGDDTESDTESATETDGQDPFPNDTEDDGAESSSGDGATTDETDETNVVAPTPGDLVITELMIDLEGDDDGLEWFEIENVSDEELTLDALNLVDEAGNDGVRTATQGMTLLPGERMVFAEREPPQVSDGAQVVLYGDGLGFDNEDGALSLAYGNTMLDTVEWSREDGWPVAKGRAMALSENRRTAVDNDYMEAWCASDVTPGGPNADCGIAAQPVPGLVITEVMPRPEDGPEWVEIRNTSDESIRLHGLAIQIDDASFTIQHGGLELPAGGVLVVSSDDMELPPAALSYVVGDLGLGGRSSIELRFEDELFDAVRYDNKAGWLVANGRSMTLDPSRRDTAANDSPLHWCLGESASPGAENTACAYLDEVPFPEPGELQVTEAMLNAPGSDAGHEWIEVYNASDHAVRLDALVVVTDDGDAAIDEVGVALEAGDYAVLAQSQDIAADLPDALVARYGDIALDNTADTISIRLGETTVAEQSYDEDAGWRLESGASIVLTDPEVGGENHSVVASWCVSRTETVLFEEMAYGTPAAANETCIVDIAPAPSVGELVLTEFVIKASGDDNGHEWIEVHNTADSPRSLNRLRISTGLEEHEIDLPGLEIEADGYAVLAQSGGFAAEYGGTATYLYGEGLDMTNEAGEVSLWMGETLIDQVFYSDDDPAWLLTSGFSASLHSASTDATENDAPLNWCLGWSNIGETTLRGTPGAANEPCPLRAGEPWDFVEDPGAYASESPEVIEVDITVDPIALAEMNAINTVAEKDAHIPAPITFSSLDYPALDGVPNATMTLRGQTSLAAPQKSWKIDLDGEAFGGQGKVHLSKHTFDATRIREHLGARVSRDVEHVPSLRVQWVHLFVNGEDYGLFTHEEHVDEQYLRRRHFDERGALFKSNNFAFLPPTAQELIDQRLESLEAKTVDDYSGAIAMLSAVQDSNNTWADVLADHFDRDNVIDFFAVAYLTKNLDTSSQNFYLYAPPNDPERFYFIPWDFDGSWDFYAQDPIVIADWNTSLGNWWGNDFWYLVFQDATFMADVGDRIEQLSASTYAQEAVRAVVDELDAVAAPFQSVAPDANSGNQPSAAAWRDEVVDGLALVPQQQLARLADDLERPMPFHTAVTQLTADEFRFTWDAPFDPQGDTVTLRVEIAPGGCGWRQFDCFSDNVILTFDDLSGSGLVLSRSVDMAVLPAGEYQFLIYATDEADVTQVCYQQDLPLSFTLD